jgi:anti-anti-sigma factor
MQSNGFAGTGDDNLQQDNHLSRLVSVGQVAAGIAHEVRNPLTAVKGFLQLLQQQSPHPYIDIAQGELENAIATLQNLLQVSKPDLDDEPVQEIHLSVELESLLHLFQDQIYRVDIKRSFKNGEQTISGKKNQLKKAFFNLLKNAFEAIPDRGSIMVEHVLQDGRIHVRIRDTGQGIPQDKLDLLGTPFFTTKENGTGMGLTQVFSTIYQHGATIQVQSKPGAGTEFHIVFPIGGLSEWGVTEMELTYTEQQTLKDFFTVNQSKFEEYLLREAVNVRDTMEEIKSKGNINLIDNAHKMVLFLIHRQEHELVQFAKEEAKLWARHSLLLAHKLEWLQVVRKVLWDFLYHYDKLTGKDAHRDEFYKLERQINSGLDTFLKHFFVTYTQFKDDILQAHRDMIEDLSVPLIPLAPSVSILALVGTIDTFRARKIQEKVLQQIGATKIRKLIIDLSGVAYLDTAVVTHLFKIIDGIAIMGCRAVVTGVRAEIANTMINMGISMADKVETKGSLEQALEEYGLKVIG